MSLRSLFALALAASFVPAHAADFVQLSQFTDGWSFQQAGKKFFSFGVTTVIPVDVPPKDRPDQGHYDGLAAHRGDVSKWVQHTATRLQSWGINTLGGWSSPEIVEHSDLYFTKVLSFGYGGNINGDRLMDVWSDSYAAAFEDWAQKEVVPLANDPRLLGYFTNNELNWHGEHGWPTDTDDQLFDRYLARPADSPGGKHVREWLKTYFNSDFAKLTEVLECKATDWAGLDAVHQIKPRRFVLAQRMKYEFAGEVAERFFALSEAAIRKHDPHHLILGCRFAGSGIMSVLKAQARHCDVIAINRYDKNGIPPLDTFDRVYAMTKKPILITEFGWRAQENRSGNKNSRGVDVTVPTQKDRAERLDTFMRGLMARPYLLGMHWFQHHDEPTNGRFDGEDSNYGLVDQRDQPYLEVTDAFTKLTREIVPGTFPRDKEFGTIAGWDENALLTVLPGDLKTAVNFLPPPEESGRVLTSCDSEHGATIKMEPGAANAWTCIFDNGTGWGVSPGFMLPANTALAGARQLHVQVRMPKDTQWRVLLSEATNSTSADGESFTTETFLGTGQNQDINVWLEDLQVRWEYGNQKGNRRIDLNGIASLGIAIPEAGKSGRAEILSVELKP